VGVDTKPSPKKICAICGEDCSSRPRTRDPKGRYFCSACYREASAKGRSPGDSDDTTSLTSTGTAELALIDDAIGQASDTTPCRGCGAPRDADAVVCTQCGLNVQTGRFEASLTGEPLMTRIKTVRGPSRWDRVVAHNRREAAKATFWHFVIPLGMLLAGFGVMTGLVTLPGADLAPQAPGAYALYLTVEVVVGVAVVWSAATLWLGGAGPLPLAVLRLAGVFAVLDALAALLAPLLELVPVPGAALIVHAGVLLALIGWQFDLNLRDALIVGVAAFALKLGTVLVLGAALA
jgi:hypothetical protein